MNKRLVASFVVLGLVILSGSLTVIAKAPSQEMYARISFPFMVGEKIFMPGDYQISLEHNVRSSIKVTSWAGTSSVKVPVIGRIARPEHPDHVTGGSLVFHRVAEMCFLSEVWMHGEDRFLVMRTTDHQIIVTAKR